jgi:hypothetical protein
MSDSADKSKQPATAWRRLAGGYPAALAVLVGFYVLMLTSLADKSATFDEVVHLTAGCTYWKCNDYRLNPENGNLPQRLMALPVLAGNFRFPALDRQAWWESGQWVLSDEFFHDLDNRVEAMLLRGRAAMGLLAVALGLLVYAWSRRLFGPAGGMVSLLLYVLNPTVLANGALMTSDMAGALFFLAATWSLWRLLHQVSPVRLAACGLATGALFLSKMSAPVMVVIAAALVVVRLVASRPVEVRLGRRRWEIARRPLRALAFGGLGVACGLVVLLTIWAAYGFRYSMMAQSRPGRDTPFSPWGELLDEPGPGTAMIQFARQHRLLPEAYLMGQTHVFRYGRQRSAFLNGEYSLQGWTWFFPYTFLVKTPLTVFALAVLALAAAAMKWRAARAAGPRRPPDRPNRPVSVGLLGPPGSGGLQPVAAAALYEASPLWTLFAVYWCFAIASHLNIGHRHILPVYPPLFVLAGSAGWWLARRGRSAWQALLLAVPMALLAGETLYRWPNYLAYFNQVVGGPANGYKHLVDSSLDWGQDLPALKRYLTGRSLPDPGRPVYLAYFGTASPYYYRIRAHLLPGFFGIDRMKRPEVLDLSGGVYCISATMLQPVLLRPAGPWNARYEAAYQQAWAEAMPLIRVFDDPVARLGIWPTRTPQQWRSLIETFDELRFARLRAYLRRRPPDDQVNYSILVYNLSDAEVRQALEGPPPELGPDVLGAKRP